MRLGRIIGFFASSLNRRQKFSLTQLVSKVGVVQTRTVQSDNWTNCNVRTNCKVPFFADDTCLHCSYDNKSIDCVQQELTKIENWLGENKLTLNQQKTYLLTPSSPLLTNRANFSFNGVTNAYAQCVKFLGLHIDVNLTFKEHVKFVQKKNSATFNDYDFSDTL